MPRVHRILAAAMTLLTGIAIWAFFAFKYPYHLHFQEQYQLFEWTGKYFVDVASVPGGLSDWLGRCLTQFFYYAPLGAVLMAVLLCGLQLLTWAVCRNRTLTDYVLSFIPALLMLAFYCDENALVGGAFALILSLACAALCLLIRPDRARHIVEVLLVPLLYLACGGLCLVFVNA